MSDNELPSRAKELVKCFTEFPERVQYYLDATDWGDTESLEHIAWISQLCAPTYDDVVTLVEDPASVYTHPSFIRLLYRDDTYKDLRNRNVRLVGALETASPRVVVEEFFNYLAELSAEDRARSFLLLASEISSNETDQGEDEERIEWLNTIVESFTTSPRALRPQLLLAASIIGHKPMVTMLLRDIATDDDPAPNIDAVEAECLIEAAVNQHFQIVKELLDGGRFSNGNETRWDAVVQALEVSCTNGAVDITDVLLPHYLSYCSVISACGVHHPRLLRLALSNWHFEIVEMLLECDPRGTLCNMMELIDTLREEVAQSAQDLAAAAEAAASAGILSIVVGEENDNMGDLIMWNAAALARGVSSANNTLVKFLVSHVGICPEALEAALETAQESGNGELVEIISNQLQKTTDRFVEEESEEGTEDEMLNSPHSDNSDEESTETQIDSGEQSLSGSIDKSWPNEPQDTRLDHTSSDDGVRSTIVPDDVPDTVRSQSTTNIALRVASFKEVERMVSAATQAIRDDSLSHYTEADDADIDATRDDLLSYLTGPEDVCMDATLDNLLSPSAKLGNIDTEDTKDIVFGHSTKVDAEINVMDQAEEIHKVEPEATQNDVLGHAKEVGDMETDALPALASDAQTRLQQFDDTRELVLLRQFSSNTVEQVLYEGKLAMGQHMMKEKDDTAALQEIEPMSNGNMCEVDDDDAPDEILVQIPIVERFQDCQNESVSPNSSEVDMGSAVREGADNRHIEPCQDSTGTDRVGDTATVDEAVVPQPSIPQSSVVALMSVVHDTRSECTDNLVEPKRDNGAPDLPVAESPPTSVLPPSIAITVFESVADNKNGESTAENLVHGSDTSVAVHDWGADLDKGADTEKPATQARRSQPRVVGSPVRTPLASPTRSTIICPVKWIDHTAGTSESSVVNVTSSAPLHEGNRVEVNYKGRSVLFPGVIIFCHSSSLYDIVYEDGEEETCVPREFIQLVGTPQNSLQNESDADQETTVPHEPADVYVPVKRYDSFLDGTERQEYQASSSPMTILAMSDLSYQSDRLDASGGVSAEAEQCGATLKSASSNQEFHDTRSERSSSLNFVGANDTAIAVDKERSREHKRRLSRDCAVSTPSPSESMNNAVSDTDQRFMDNVLGVEHLPEIPSIVVPSSAPTINGKELMNEIRLASATSRRSSRDRGLSFASQRSRCRTADNVSSEDMAEWKNVDLLLNRKRRLFQTQTGSVETVRVPWGEEFATIQSLKRFAAQHSDVLRAYIPGVFATASPSSLLRYAVDQEALMIYSTHILWLRCHRSDTIVPVVMPTVFNTEKRFLCETATEVLDAIILHCSGRKLALVFLQLGETYSKHEDLRLYNLSQLFKVISSAAHPAGEDADVEVGARADFCSKNFQAPTR
ncbi:hypothetical protein ON010_g10850 [Phytophthora cinnamomi]|nr:hypothetical protein ON010_g10850 [Phytophthora cinnamomi]